MKINGKKCSAIALAMTTALSFAACGGGSTESGNGGDDKAIDIVIYAGGSTEFSWTAGKNEEAVIDYIENKYYEDTGTRLNFKTNLTLGKNMKDNIANDVREGKVDIIISHTSGGVGIDDWALQEDNYYDLSDYVDDFMEDAVDDGCFTWSDGSMTIDALRRMTNEKGELIGIPSVINPYKFGILVRKDWMEAAGYTDNKDDTSKTYVGDFETFTAMAKKIKEQQNLDYAITGAIFDVEKAGLLGACGVDAGTYTNTVYTEDGVTYCGPGYINPNYKDVLLS